MTQFFSAQWTRVSTVAAIHPLLAACGKGQQAAAPPPAAADKPAYAAGRHRQRHADFARGLR